MCCEGKMNIREITDNKKQYLSLLLLADEQESMIDRYLEKGEMYVLEDHGVKAVCVVQKVSAEILEIKNLATETKYQRMGYGQAIIHDIVKRYQDDYSILQVGTGETTVGFYEKCGFRRSHVIKNFFTDYYNHPIFEYGKQLIDMIYLQKTLK